VYKSRIPAPLIVLFIYLAVALRGVSLFGQLFEIRKMETGDWFTINVTAITQDFQSYIWIGTDNGLYHFDGRKAVRFPGSDFMITSLLESTDSTLWIGTTNGVRSLDKNRTCLKTYQQDVNLVMHVRSVVEDRQSGIWTVSFPGIVFNYSKSGITELKPSGTERAITLVNLAFDNRNNLWATTTDTGLVMMGRDGRIKEYHRLPYPAKGIKTVGRDLIISSEFHSHKFDPESKTLSIHASLPERGERQFVITLFEYSQTGKLWVYKSGKELKYFNTNTGIYHDLSSMYANAGPPHMEVNTLFLDKYGLLWLGTNAGLYTLATYEKQFNNILLPLQDERKPYLSLRGIYQDSTHYLYFGSYRGFFRYNLSNGNIREILLSNDEREGKNPLVYAIAPDPLEDSILWLASEGNGLLKYNKNVGRITLTIPEPENISEQDALLKGVYWIFSVLPDEDRIWAGTSDGLYYFSRGTDGGFIRENAIKKDLRVNVLKKTKDGSMWIGTINGLYLRTKLGAIEGASSLNGKTITALCITNDGLLWVGTRHNGLFRYNHATGETRHYGSLSGLLNESIAGILRGGEDELWISTNYGLSRFNMATEEFANFYTNSGLTDNEFNTGSAFRANDGTLYFGTVNGINFFKPSEIVSWSVPPRILLTELRQHIGNRDTTIVRHFNLETAPAITLRHNDNPACIKFFR
jgi:ligand-binding sensor domain-containing protein